MMRALYIIIGVLVVVAIVLLYLFMVARTTDIEFSPEQAEINMEPETIQEADAELLPNPATIHCVDDLGGDYRIVETVAGQIGLCHLPDGRWCEEWKLYRTGLCVLPEDISDAVLYGKG